MDPSWSGYASGHEMGHNWGQNHYTSTRDYTGDNFWHVAMDGSGIGYSTVDAYEAQNQRRNTAKGGIEWVQYNYQIAAARHAGFGDDQDQSTRQPQRAAE